MNLKDRLWIIKNHIFDKRNYIFITILFFIFIAIFITLTFYNCATYISYYEKERLASKNINIDINNYSKEKEELIKNIDHVVSIDIFMTNASYNVKEFNSITPGYITISPLIDQNDIEIIKGTNIQKEYDMVCPNLFYPHDAYETIYKSDYLKGKEIVDKSVVINNQTFTIVGTYDAKKIRNHLSECFVSKNTFKKLNPEKVDTSQLTIRVDKQENRREVIRALTNIDITNIDINIINTNYNLIYISIFITIIILFISFAIIYNFIKKKLRYRLNNYGILKVSGYQNKEIFKLDILENLIVSTICFIVSAIFFYIVYNLIINSISSLDYYIYTSEINLEINYFYILLSYLFMIIMIFIATKYLNYKYLNQSINYLLKDE